MVSSVITRELVSNSFYIIFSEVFKNIKMKSQILRQGMLLFIYFRMARYYILAPNLCGIFLI